MHDIDLNLLPVLRVLLEEGSVTRAAARVHLSVAATSRALERARRTLGDPLLVPDGRGVTATPVALDLLPRLVDALDRLDAVLARPVPFHAATIRRTFSIRGNEAVVAALGAVFTATVAAEAPHAMIRFEAETPDDICDLRAGRVDLGIGAYGDLHRDLVAEPIATETMVGAIGVHHALAARRRVTLAALATVDHVAVSRRGRARGPLDEALAGAGRTRRIVAVVPSYAAAIALVLQSDLATMVPRRLGQTFARSGGLHLFELPLPDTQRHVVATQVWHGRLTADPEHAWLRNQVRIAAGAGATPASGADRLDLRDDLHP